MHSATATLALHKYPQRQAGLIFLFLISLDDGPKLLHSLVSYRYHVRLPSYAGPRPERLVPMCKARLFSHHTARCETVSTLRTRPILISGRRHRAAEVH